MFTPTVAATEEARGKMTRTLFISFSLSLSHIHNKYIYIYIYIYTHTHTYRVGHLNLSTLITRKESIFPKNIREESCIILRGEEVSDLKAFFKVICRSNQIFFIYFNFYCIFYFLLHIAYSSILQELFKTL